MIRVHLNPQDRLAESDYEEKKNVGGTFCIGITLIHKNHKNPEGQKLAQTHIRGGKLRAFFVTS